MGEFMGFSPDPTETFLIYYCQDPRRVLEYTNDYGSSMLEDDNFTWKSTGVYLTNQDSPDTVIERYAQKMDLPKSAFKCITCGNSMSVVNWQNPDVHHRTIEMRTQLLKEFPDLPQQTVDRKDDFNRAAIEILQMYKGNQVIELAINKMMNRKNLIDNDLCGVSPAGLLAIVWFDMIKVYSAYNHMKDTMEDVGPHCLQGDSHRLFATYIAFSRLLPKWAEILLHKHDLQ